MQALQYEVVLGSPLCKLCSTKSYLGVLCVSLVVGSSTGVLHASFAVRRSAGVLCASCAVRSNTAKYLVQALWYEVVPGSTLCKLCSTK